MQWAKIVAAISVSIASSSSAQGVQWELVDTGVLTTHLTAKAFRYAFSLIQSKKGYFVLIIIMIFFGAFQ